MAAPAPDSEQAVAGSGRGFGYLWTAVVASSIGDGAYLVGAPLLAALLTKNPMGVAVVSTAAAAPWFLVGFWSGAVVDRFPRRRVLITADVVRAIGLALLAVLVATGHASIAALAATSFLVFAGKSFHDAAAQAIVPYVVGRSPEALTRANGRIFAGETVSQTVAGPPLGGAAFAVAPWLPFALDAGSFAASAGLLTRVPAPPAADRPEGQSLGESIREGFRYLFHRRDLVTLALALAAFNLAYNLANATIVLFAKDTLHVTDFGFGLLVAAGAAGAALTGLFAQQLVGWLGTGGSVMASLLVQAAAWTAVAVAPSAWLAGPAFAVLGMSTTLVTVAVVSARQQLVPDRLLGRVVSAFRLLGNGAAPIGAALGGVVASFAGLRAPLILVPVILVLALSALAVPLVRPR